MELLDNIGAQFGRLMVCEILRPCPNLPLSSWWYPDSTQDIALAKNLARHLCANQEMKRLSTCSMLKQLFGHTDPEAWSMC